MPLYDDDGNELNPEQVMAYLDQQQQNPQETEPNWRRGLERRAQTAQQKAQEAEARAVAAERKLAFAEVGIPLDNPLTSYFVAGYQGDVTAEAIRAKAAEIGLVQPTQQTQQQAAQQAQNTQQAQAFQQIGDAMNGQAVPAGRNWDAEKAAAPDRETLHRIVQEQAQAEGRAQPAIVHD